EPGGDSRAVVFHGRRNGYALCHRPHAAGIGGAGGALFALVQGAAADESRLHRTAGRHLLDAGGAVFRGTAPQRYRRFSLARAAPRSHDGTGSKTVAGVPVWCELAGAGTAQRRGIAGSRTLADEVRNRAQSRAVAAL